MTNNLPKEKERGRVGESERRSCGESRHQLHLVDFPPHPKQKQKHEKSNINCSNCKLKSRRFFQGAPCLQVKIYENQFSTNTCLCALAASVRTRTNETTPTIFKPAFLFNFFNGFSTQLAPLEKQLSTCCSRQFSSVRVCVR